MTPEQAREQMVVEQIAGRALTNPRILKAMRRVPRHRFVGEAERAHAYDDEPLPIAEGQTISQPYIVALMTEAARLRPTDRVLEVGTGSGYAAAVLSELTGEVFTIERREVLAAAARTILTELGYDRVHVRSGDGTLGWPDEAPFDAIVVAAGGPEAPGALLEQLKVEGRLVIPIGPEDEQRLVRITRTGVGCYDEEDLGAVRFVPLVGAQGWPSPSPHALCRLIAECLEPMEDLEQVALAPLLDRIGDAELVLLGEASHGTSEFYRMRARITRELIERRGFTVVALEADWPDAAQLDRAARHLPPTPDAVPPFQRFPAWMWRNLETERLMAWLAEHNAALPLERRVRVCGLDLYSMHASIAAVIDCLERIDPAAARQARARYACLAPFLREPADYGLRVRNGHAACEEEVLAVLAELHARRTAALARLDEALFDAVQNARLIANAERYYRAMYSCSTTSWNLRDTHMFETLEALRSFLPGARIVVWAHNSHVGDAGATEMGAAGEHNVGQLCRRAHGDRAYAIGFGTDHGVVAAAAEWGASMRFVPIRPAHQDSYERVFARTGTPAFLLALRHPRRDELREELSTHRLERAIGVIYRPETELQSHYFEAELPRQFDEYVWFGETGPTHPLDLDADARRLAG
jgi:protein-L-isoaspartate(D-aspartate) O-methyltransferase